MNELLRKKKIISQIIENYNLTDEEFEVMIEVLEIVKDRIWGSIEKRTC